MAECISWARSVQCISRARSVQCIRRVRSVQCMSPSGQACDAQGPLMRKGKEALACTHLGMCLWQHGSTPFVAALRACLGRSTKLLLVLAAVASAAAHWRLELVQPIATARKWSNWVCAASFKHGVIQYPSQPHALLVARRLTPLLSSSLAHRQPQQARVPHGFTRAASVAAAP